jgi:hypothetical protein
MQHPRVGVRMFDIVVTALAVCCEPSGGGQGAFLPGESELWRMHK